MDKLSYSEVMAILGNAKFPFITISREGVFIDDNGLDERLPEYEIIRVMESAHPQKDIAKPLFTFPCSVEQLRDFLIDNEAVGQLSGVIYLENTKEYNADDIVALMLLANIFETSLLPPEQHLSPFSILYKTKFLDDHQGQKTHYQQQIIKFLERYSIVVTTQNIDEELKNISFKNIMGNVVTWLQSERFAVFFNSQSYSQNLTQENERPKQQLPVADTPKATRTRKDPVREAMESIITTNPTVNKAEMWAELQKLARSSKPPFVDEQDEHTLLYVAGGAAKKDIKKLTKEQADTRLISYKMK